MKVMPLLVVCLLAPTLLHAGNCFTKAEEPKSELEKGSPVALGPKSEIGKGSPVVLGLKSRLEELLKEPFSEVLNKLSQADLAKFRSTNRELRSSVNEWLIENKRLIVIGGKSYLSSQLIFNLEKLTQAELLEVEAK